MARIAILADIHANRPALEAVLAEAEGRGVTETAFLGDIVGYGGSPAACVDLVRSRGGRCAMGNHDARIAAVRRSGGGFPIPDWQSSPYFSALAFAAAELDPDQFVWLASLPDRMWLTGGIAAHANLAEPGGFSSIEDLASASATLDILQSGRTRLGFFGHTHRPGIFTREPGALEWLDAHRVRIPLELPCAVIAGAVGWPGPDGDLGAHWILWDSDERIVGFRNTPYDRLRAARDIRNAGLPLASALTLLNEEEKALVSKAEADVAPSLWV